MLPSKARIDTEREPMCHGSVHHCQCVTIGLCLKVSQPEEPARYISARPDQLSPLTVQSCHLLIAPCNNMFGNLLFWCRFILFPFSLNERDFTVNNVRTRNKQFHRTVIVLPHMHELFIHFNKFLKVKLLVLWKHLCLRTRMFPLSRLKVIPLWNK